MLVFDALSWSKTGDVDDNSIYWKPAEILRTYRNYPHHGEELADVQFEDGRISHAHFTKHFKPLEPQR